MCGSGTPRIRSFWRVDRSAEG